MAWVPPIGSFEDKSRFLFICLFTPVQIKIIWDFILLDQGENEVSHQLLCRTRWEDRSTEESWSHPIDLMFHLGAKQCFDNQTLEALCMDLYTSLTSLCSSELLRKSLPSHNIIIFFKGKKWYLTKDKVTLLDIGEWSPAQEHGTHIIGDQEMSEPQRQWDSWFFRACLQVFSVGTNAWFLWEADSTHKDIYLVKSWFHAKFSLTWNFQSVPDVGHCKWHQNCIIY